MSASSQRWRLEWISAMVIQRRAQIAATGSRLALTLLLEMRRRDVEHGLATLCVGGGLGGAIVFQRVAASE